MAESVGGGSQNGLGRGESQASPDLHPETCETSPRPGSAGQGGIGNCHGQFHAVSVIAFNSCPVLCVWKYHPLWPIRTSGLRGEMTYPGSLDWSEAEPGLGPRTA